MVSKFDFSLLFIEQARCIVGAFKKRLRPCVCDETSSRWQGKNNSKATEEYNKHEQLISLHFTTWHQACVCVSIWQGFFCRELTISDFCFMIIMAYITHCNKKTKEIIDFISNFLSENAEKMNQLWAMKCAQRHSWENLWWVGIQTAASGCSTMRCTDVWGSHY